MSNLMDALPTQAVFPTKPRQGFPPAGPHPKRATATTQLIAMQELLYADACSDECKGAKRAMITRAWKELQELRLRLQMKAPPKPVDVAELERLKAKAKARQAGQQPEDWRRGKRKAQVAPTVVPMVDHITITDPQPGAATPTQAS